jgi:predicted pyridoxine 5'-phosphate oxidase superfamily flavin-nucleotide-binding protein
LVEELEVPHFPVESLVAPWVAAIQEEEVLFLELQAEVVPLEIHLGVLLEAV